MAFYAAILTRQDEPAVQKLVTAMQYGALALLAAALWALARALAGPCCLAAVVGIDLTFR
jgi:multisubunit Na+/H+ antiporter MnhF subunit